MLIGELAGILGLDAKPFEQGIDKAAKGGEGRLKMMSTAVKAIFAATGVAVGAALSKGFSDYLDIDAGMDKLAAQLDLSAEDSRRAGAIAGRLYGQAYGESIEHTQSAVGAVIASLTDGTAAAEDDIERLAAKALDLSAAFELDVQRSARSAGILLRSGLARDADHAFDLITAGMQRMPADLREELLEASDEYSQFFDQLGISGEEAFGLLSDAAQDGVYGIDKVGDGLKELTIRATDMSTASVDAYKAAGLNAGRMADRFIKGGETARGALDDLVDGLLGIRNPVTRANSAIALFGTPIEDLNVGEIPQFLRGLQSMDAELGNVEGAADRMGETLNDNWKTKIEAWKRQGMMRLVGFIQTRAIPTIEDLARRYGPDLARVMDVGRRAVQRVVDVFGERGLAGVVELARRKWDGLSPAMKAVVAGLGAVVAILAGGVVVGAIAAIAGAVAALLSPVVLAVAGVAALAAGVVYAYHRFEVFQRVVQVVTAGLVAASRAVVDGARRAWPVLQAAVARAAAAIRSAVGVAVGWLTTTALPALRRFAAVVAEQFATLTVWVRNHWDDIREAITHVLNVTQAVITTTLKVVAGVVLGVLRGLQIAWATFGNTILANVRSVWNILVAVVQAGVSLVRGIVETALHLINGDWGEAWDAITRMLSEVWGHLGTILGEAGWIIVRTLGAVLAAAGQVVAAALRWIVGQVAQMPGRMLAVLAALGRLLWNLVTAAFKLVLTGVQTGIGWIIGQVAQMPGRMLSAAGDLFGFIATSAAAAVALAVDFIAGLPGKLLDVVEQIAGAAKDIGGKIIDGIIDGITGAAGFVGDFAARMVQGLIDFVNNHIIDTINDAIPDRLGAGPLSIGLPKNPVPHLPSLPGREHGGPVRKGRAYVVGEKRPEVFVPGEHGTILPSLAAMANAGAARAIDRGARLAVHVGLDEDRLGRAIARHLDRPHNTQHNEFHEVKASAREIAEDLRWIGAAA